MKRLLIILPLFFLFPSVSHAALSDNIVSYWKLDESSGNATDSAGGKTLTNANSTAYGTGIINNGASLVKTSSNYFSRTNDVYDLTSGSISLWFKTTSITALDTIISTEVNNTTKGFEIRLDSSTQLSFYFGAGGSICSTSGVTFSNGTWYHVVAIWTTSGKEVYINNVSRCTSGAETLTAGNNNLYLGANDFNNTNSPARFFNGVIDEVGIWSRALTGTEVSQLYNSGAGFQYPFASSSTGVLSLLRAFWIR